MATKFVGIKELRQDMAKITKNAQERGDRIIVLRKNKPVFELWPLTDEAALVESFRRDIEEALDEKRKGEVYSQDEVEKILGL